MGYGVPVSLAQAGNSWGNAVIQASGSRSRNCFQTTSVGLSADGTAARTMGPYTDNRSRHNPHGLSTTKRRRWSRCKQTEAATGWPSRKAAQYGSVSWHKATEALSTRGLVPVTIVPSPSTIAAAPCSDESGNRLRISDRHAVTAASSMALSTRPNLGAYASLDRLLAFRTGNRPDVTRAMMGA